MTKIQNFLSRRAKIFFTLLVLILFSAILFSPVIAAEKPAQCCKLKHDITVNDESVTAGKWVGVSVPSGKAIKDICPGHGGTGATDANYNPKSNWAVYCSLDAIKTVADLINAVAIILSGVVLVLAAVLFFTAAGDPNRIKTAKTFFFWGLIGVCVIILANFIPAFARFFLGI